MSTYGVAHEVRARVIELLVADHGAGSIGELLFSRDPRLDDTDDRIYSATADHPGSPEVLAMLPRIIVSVLSDEGVLTEQRDPERGGATVWVHSIAAAGTETLGEALDQRVRRVLLSTSLSSERIIAADLVAEGVRQHVRERSFNDAHRFTSQFRSASVGVKA